MNRIEKLARGLIYRVPGGRRLVSEVRRQQVRTRAKRLGLSVAWHNGAGGSVEFSKGLDTLIVNARHMTYAADLIREFDVYIAAVEPILQGSRRIIDFSKPAWHRMAGSGDEAYLTSFVEGEAINEIYLAHARLAPGDTVLDLGANCGLASLAFARAVGPKGRVIAMEPDPENFKALMLNLEHHKVLNVTAVNEGVWSQSGHISFESDGSMGALAISSGEVGTGRGVRMEISVSTLDDLAERFELAAAHFVKMDIESSERFVVPSLQRFLRRFRPRFLIEAHGSEIALVVKRFFSGNGYKVRAITPSANHNLPLLLCEPSGDELRHESP